MSLVTIGLDFGTSSIKAVARPVLAQNSKVELLRSASGSLRQRSMLGMVREGQERGRLLLFDECDDERWRFCALSEPNLKLALLVQPDAPVAEALESRWQVHYRALPTLLLAAALQEALAATERCFGGRAIHIYGGAPVAPDHPPEQSLVFERALFAADLLCRQWNGVVPSVAERALREAEQAWMEAASLPPESDRRTFIAPEGLAAFEGVASTGRRANLPIGRLCIIDMGGGTTDIAWLNSRGHGDYQPLHIASLDIAGERIDAAIATDASRFTGRRVDRAEIWAARSSLASQDGGLHGDGWSYSRDKLRAMLWPILEEFTTRFRRACVDLDRGRMKGAATRFAFVGGATKWSPLAEFLLEALGEVHDGAETLTTSDFGLSVSSEGVPLTVSLGLSGGRSGLQLDRWRFGRRTESSRTAEFEVGPLAFCDCKGLLELCHLCGGSGIKDSEAGVRRFHAAIDPFRRHAQSVRCPYCSLDFARNIIFEHTAQAHAVKPVEQPLMVTPPPTNGAPTLSIKVDAIRAAVMSSDPRQLSPAEQVVWQDLQWLRQSCVLRASDGSSLAEHYLRHTIKLASRYPWFHLPRAIAFALLEDANGVRRECEKAEEIGLDAAKQIASILETGHHSRFVEALEHALS